MTINIHYILFISLVFIFVFNILCYLYHKYFEKHIQKINLKSYYKHHKNDIIVYNIVFILILIIFIFFYKTYKGLFKIKNNLNKNQKGGGINNKSIKKNKLLNLCGLPISRDTEHCFNDSTHHTCCKLGPKAREYSEKTNNPIGKISEKSYKKKYKKSVSNKDLTSWCTCFGSEVCSFYANKFNDGTHIEFINVPNSSTKIIKNVNKNCEGYYRDTLDIQSHSTPGVKKI